MHDKRLILFSQIAQGNEHINSIFPYLRLAGKYVGRYEIGRFVLSQAPRTFTKKFAKISRCFHQLESDLPETMGIDEQNQSSNSGK